MKTGKVEADNTAPSLNADWNMSCFSCSEPKALTVMNFANSDFPLPFGPVKTKAGFTDAMVIIASKNGEIAI